MSNLPLLGRFCRESYTHPLALYHQLKRRRMDLVTVTDHDSIEAAEPLRRFPDFFLSQEATCRLPTGTVIHVGVYGITERQHAQIQRRRDDLPALVAWLSEKRLLFSLNHAFSALTGRRTREDFDWFARCFPAFETRNGQMLARSNRLAAELARGLRRAAVAGSDAHTLASAGSAWTEVPGAATPVEFLEAVRRGAGRARGGSGGYWRLTADVLRIVAAMLEERPGALPLAPLAALVPLATLANFLGETAFQQYWSLRLGREGILAAGRATRPRLALLAAEASE